MKIIFYQTKIKLQLLKIYFNKKNHKIKNSNLKKKQKKKLKKNKKFKDLIPNKKLNQN